MGKHRLILIASFFMILMAASADPGKGQQPPFESFSARTAAAVISEWPQASAKTAMDMILKYGAPDDISSDFLYWRGKGGFIEIIAWKELVEHRFPARHYDTLEESIAYEVPVEKLKDLAVFNGSITVGRTRGVLSVRSENEAMNFLALNLAHDIAANLKSVQDARMAYSDISKSYARGEFHPYTKGIRFDISRLRQTKDPDYQADRR